MVKSYKINNTWDINCITNTDGSMSIDVIMVSVPWQEVVESTGKVFDKDLANSRFKELVQKYKKLGEASFI